MILRAALLVPPALAAATSAQATFAPPVDVPLTCTITETRDDGTTTQHFSASRTIVFHRDGSGYLAEVTVLPQPAGRQSDARAIFDTAMSALSGAPLRFRLHAAGTILSVDDAEVLWQRLVGAIEGMTRGDTARAATIATLTRALREMPPPRRQAILGSMLSSVMAVADAGRPAGEDRAVSVPGERYGGDKMTLAGRETTRDVGGEIEITTRASGNGTGGTQPDGAFSLLRVREIDRRTGLVLRQTEETVGDIVVTGTPHRFRKVKTTTLAPVVS